MIVGLKKELEPPLVLSNDVNSHLLLGALVF
jgi:hypothetical protein